MYMLINGGSGDIHMRLYMYIRGTYCGITHVSCESVQEWNGVVI